MKAPDEIKKALEICSNGGIWDCDACPYGDSDDCWECRSDLYEDAAAYIKQLENQIGELTEKVAHFEAAQSKWISVEERLPDDDELYLVFVSARNEIDVSRYYGDGEWLTNDLDNLTRYVTHWMPLPQPPKEESHGTKGTAKAESHVRPARGE